MISSQAAGTATLLQAAAVMAASEPAVGATTTTEPLSISAMPVSMPMGMAHSFLINNFVTVAAPPTTTMSGGQYLDKS